MAQLIQLRQRIKAIETIKKMAHAMRLISMSAHTRLKTKEEALSYYRQALTSLFTKIQRATPGWQNPILSPENPTNIALVILIGSQKGLCGSFNINLLHFFDAYKKAHPDQNFEIITIGKRCVNYAKNSNIGRIIASFEDLSTKTIAAIAHNLTDRILSAQQPYSQVLVFNNMLKNFFVQKPQVLMLVPFAANATEQTTSTTTFEDYIWQQKVDDILDILAKQYLDANLQSLLFESLLAEHAARFISMDNSTRNAQNLLETTRMDYNKLRQAKITKELAELIGSF